MFDLHFEGTMGPTIVNAEYMTLWLQEWAMCAHATGSSLLIVSYGNIMSAFLFVTLSFCI